MPNVKEIESNVPNLDAMGKDDLWSFWKNCSNRSYQRWLFPTRPEGYVLQSKRLQCYASNKATAISCRESGEINSALEYERICEAIYATLHYYAKW